jgi:hypothetical protein
MTLINDCAETQNERNASKSYLTTQNRSKSASKIDSKKKIRAQFNVKYSHSKWRIDA